MYGVAPGTGTAAILGRLHRPFEPERTTAALLGLSGRAARQLIGAVLACSDEAEDLLDAMPRILRSLAIATTDRPERCMGELRGPVLWSETMSARSASAGDPGLFVCATTTKAYDTDQNRVLKAALSALEQAGLHAELGMEGHTDEVVRRARHNGHRAARLLEHQTLSQVPSRRPSRRELGRTRAGNRRHTYQPALAMLRRAASPLLAEHMQAFADQRTRAQHDLLASVLDHLDADNGRRTLLRSHHGALVGGPVRYQHPARRGEGDAIDGIWVGSVLLDVPEPLGAEPEEARVALERRAGDRPAILALGPDDVTRAVAQAIA
mgnify:CR=1 FL=1